VTALLSQAAAAGLGVDAARCLFVDDSAANVRAASALGMTGVLYRELADLQRALGRFLLEPGKIQNRKSRTEMRTEMPKVPARLPPESCRDLRR
jgi:FMN phosphatase YigB (HAD superfamily)